MWPTWWWNTLFAFADVSEARQIADANSVGVSRRHIMSGLVCRFKSLYWDSNDYVSVRGGLSGRNVLSCSFSCSVQRSDGPLRAPHKYRESLDLSLDETRLIM